MCLQLILFLVLAPDSYNPVYAAGKKDDNGVYNQDVIDNYRQLVKKLQTDNGPFDPRLSDPLLGLGQALKNGGNYAEAADIFRRAMYIKRVNNGLYDLDQITILENVIECNTALHNWDEVDDEYQYLLWIFEKAYPEPDPARLAALEEVINWHLTAFTLSSETLPAQHLITARDLNKNAVELAEQLYGSSSRETASRLYKLALAEYYIAVGIQHGGPDGLALADSLLIMNRNPSYYSMSLKLVAKIYRKGVRLLRRIIDIYSDAGAAEPWGEAMAMVYLADWNLLFNKQRTAARLYKDAYETFMDSGGNSALIDNYFSKPVLLPLEEFIPKPDTFILPEHIQVQFEKTGDEPGYIRNLNKYPLISWSGSLPGLAYPATTTAGVIPFPNNSYAVAGFDVSKKGLAEKIRILDYQSHDVMTRKRAYDMLWSMQFRPRLVKGRPVYSRDYRLRYTLPE